VQVGDSGECDDGGDSEAFNGNDNDDLSFMQSGMHDENQDDGELNSQERSVLQDNLRKKKRNGVNAKYYETIIEIEKKRANFLEEATKKIPGLKMKIYCLFAVFYPTSITYQPI
jgi:hypothetical protein